MDIAKFDALWFQMSDPFMPDFPYWAATVWEDYDAMFMAWDGL